MRIATLKYIIHGNVQGVGFRREAQKIALELGLKGSVRNLKNGSVEIIAQGSLEVIHQLIERLKKRFKIEKLNEIPCELTSDLVLFQIVH